MGIDHCGLEILVTKQLLNRPDIISIFQQVGREAVSEGMHGGLLDLPVGNVFPGLEILQKSPERLCRISILQAF